MITDFPLLVLSVVFFVLAALSPFFAAPNPPRAVPRWEWLGFACFVGTLLN